MINDTFQTTVLHATGARKLHRIGLIQNLWSGYGKIERYGLKGADRSRVVIKNVRLPEQDRHVLGWNTDLSHDRKVRSYQVEMAWYTHWSQRCGDDCRVPECLALDTQDDEVLMVLEDLDEAGFPDRQRHVGMTQTHACLSWLAHFHATFMGDKPDGLWDVGTYWHLDTRPDELAALDDLELKNAAVAIDRRLRNSPYQTIVHGDAKLANFCFSKDGTRVDSVDFQYVGGGCGMKDVAYCISSCLDESDCARHEGKLLAYYFRELKDALIRYGKSVDGEAVEADWRALYPVAWTDFHRFLLGWSPGWGHGHYSRRLARQVLDSLKADGDIQ
jgi:hypothetical protein